MWNIALQLTLISYFCTQQLNVSSTERIVSVSCLREKEMNKDNKKGMLALLFMGAFAMSTLLMSSMPSNDIMTKDGATTIINTTKLGRNVRGYRGQTPIKIYITRNKVQKIETLKNRDTPQYFKKAKTLLDKYEGKSVSRAMRMKVDGVTGATFSSNALKQNVELGLEYYKKHR